MLLEPHLISEAGQPETIHSFFRSYAVHYACEGAGVFFI